MLDITMIRKLAKLARIDFSVDEELKYLREIENLLGWIAVLNDVNIDGIKPLCNTNDLYHTIRDRLIPNKHYIEKCINDEVFDKDSLPIVANASYDSIHTSPERIDGFYVVPGKVVD